MCLEHVSRREMLKLASLFTVAGAAPLLSALNAQAQPAAVALPVAAMAMLIGWPKASERIGT